VSLRRFVLRHDVLGSFAQGAYGPKHRNVALDPKKGMLILDILEERIVGIEILYRDEIRERLLELLP